MLTHRPRAHLTPPAGWMNDPNGLIHWRGEYHVFYQHNPFSTEWAAPHWGHAVSADLVTWRHLPVAMQPRSGAADADGCFSGCMVDDGQPTPAAVYTGVCRVGDDYEQATCLARATDGLRRLVHHPANPVLTGPPEPEATEGFRDPFVWREDGRWHQLVGSGDRRRGGIVYEYVSADLLTWDYIGVFHRGTGKPGDPLDTGVMWECPQLVRDGDRAVLIVSVLDQWDQSRRKVVGMSGHRHGGAFRETGIQLVDHGSAFYAPAVTVDATGRTLLWGWIQETQASWRAAQQGWSGALTLPREVWIDDDARLRSRPAAETQQLRSELLATDRVRLAADSIVESTADGAYLWIELTSDVSQAEGLCLHMLRDPAGQEYTTLRYDSIAGKLSVENNGPTLLSTQVTSAEGAPYRPSDGVIRLNVILDGSTLEVFAEDTVALTTRVYPRLPTNTGLALQAVGGPVETALDCWRLRPIM